MRVDTIAALATPSGRGGIAVIRVSGPLTQTIIRDILHGELAPRAAAYLPFFAADNEILDEGIAIFFLIRIHSQVKMYWNCKVTAALLSLI